MLIESEKRGIGELLERMEGVDLNSLAQTVTNRLIVPQSRGDAVQVLVHFYTYIICTYFIANLFGDLDINLVERLYLS